jgi:2-amino-4-hydroxy-6-hydroxymethyldihydropteridine diphosphokinase
MHAADRAARQTAMPLCLIGLGSNQGNRQAILDAAVARLAAHAQVKMIAVGPWRETAPVGGPAGQPPFLNGALQLQTSLEPHELLAAMRQIENELGRTRDVRWAPRTIDLDLLLYGDLVLNTPALAVPHPRMAWRRFVLDPAAAVAGDMLHPVIGWTVARLLDHLNSARPYVAITGAIAAGKTRLAERLAAAVSARLIAERPDWTRLDAFYADPTSHAWQTELEFVAERARLLNSEAFRQTETDAAGRWVVSDFWFDQSAAFARAWLPEEQLPAFIEQFEQLRRTVAQPKLIVVLDSPADQLLAGVRRRGRQCERRLTFEQLDRIRHTVRQQAGRPGLGPVLQTTGDEPETVFAEVLAAVRGME